MNPLPAKPAPEASSPDLKPLLAHAVPHPVASPFSGMAGRSFLRFCIWVDNVSLWNETRHNRQAKAPETSLWFHLASGLSLEKSGPWMVGVLSCTVAASLSTALFYASSFKSALPFAFLAIIALIALRFGRVAGVVGTISASLVFASVLFEPRPSLAVEDPIAKAHLMWMVVIGMVLSELAGGRMLRQRTEIAGASAITASQMTTGPRQPKF
jgi:K+-sensing histidine kinase KdpD